jgi:hypothetical protein
MALVGPPGWAATAEVRPRTLDLTSDAVHRGLQKGITVITQVRKGDIGQIYQVSLNVRGGAIHDPISPFCIHTNLPPRRLRSRVDEATNDDHQIVAVCYAETLPRRHVNGQH